MSRVEFEQNLDMDSQEGDAYDTVFGADNAEAAPAPAKRGRGRPKGSLPGQKKDGSMGVRKKIKREEDRRYHAYIKKVFKTIHPDMSIHPDTVSIINTCIYDVMTQICEEASMMNSRANKSTMTASDIKFAVRTLFPPEIAKHAETEGVMALARSEGDNVDV